MSRHLTLHPLTAALAAAFLAAVAAPAVAKAPATGIVLGVDGKVYAHAKVCVDRNHNARCDGNEVSTFSGADGRFKLEGQGALVAEIGKGSFLVDASAGTKVAVKQPLVLQSPLLPSDVERAVGPLSTELQALLDVMTSEEKKAIIDGAKGTPGVTNVEFWPWLEADERLRLRVLGRNSDNRKFVISAGSRNRMEDFLDEPDPALRAALVAEQQSVVSRIASAVADTGRKDDLAAVLASRLGLDRISNIVVIYAENRSFNNLFANFPGATGGPSAKDAKKKGAAPAFAPQKDRDGTVLAKLPPAWGGLTAAGQPVTVTQAQTTNVWPNAPFQVDAATPAWGSPALPNTIITRDLVHRFYENQMQIDGGLNDKFAAWGDSGGVVMGWFDGSRTAMWKIARDYTLADRFFQGAFGGSYLNHQYLVCACMPEYPNADTNPAKPSIAVLRTDAAGKFLPELALADNSPASAMAGPPVFKKSGNLTPKDYLGDGTFHTVNTMQPPYQPSYNPPAPDDTAGQYATPLEPTTLPPQTLATIGDLLTGKGVGWTWYAGGWNASLADRTKVYDAGSGNFQAHHQPFNYYAAFDPKTHAADRAAHLKDYADLVADAAAGKLAPVVFYKPVGKDNEHPGYASLAEGDAHLADTIAKLQASPQWAHMLVVVTYDENGGQWDEVAPPKGDLVGPGTRVPAVIISPFARRGAVDHTPYDTGSIARFITHRWSLPVLPGLKLRDASLEANGLPAMGDLTAALELRAH
jgi:acid phosphatase